MSSYEAARCAFSVFEICARFVVLVGIVTMSGGGLLADGGIGGNIPAVFALLIGVLPGGVIALMGFYGLATAQMGRATVDSAEYAQQSLEVSRQQLELSRQALEQGRSGAASYGGQSGAPRPGQPGAPDRVRAVPRCEERQGPRTGSR